MTLFGKKYFVKTFYLFIELYINHNSCWLLFRYNELIIKNTLFIKLYKTIKIRNHSHE